VSGISQAMYFSIRADEIIDTSERSVCVRYILVKEILADYIGFSELLKMNTETITNKLVESLKLWNYNLDPWRGKGCENKW
jgi:hypothetical protein